MGLASCQWAPQGLPTCMSSKPPHAQLETAAVVVLHAGVTLVAVTIACSLLVILGRTKAERTDQLTVMAGWLVVGGLV
jgi:hypothetical protein